MTYGLSNSGNLELHSSHARNAGLFMAALCNRGAIIFLPRGFYLSIYLFFPRLISAATDWMSTILLHMVWP